VFLQDEMLYSLMVFSYDSQVSGSVPGEEPQAIFASFKLPKKLATFQEVLPESLNPKLPQRETSGPPVPNGPFKVRDNRHFPPCS
jgi:hypothetical protein